MPRPSSGDNRYDGASRATLSGILDLFRRRERIGRLGDQDRIDGKSCLVTGANRGLGRAVAIELARRGGCRPQSISCARVPSTPASPGKLRGGSSPC